MLFVSQPEFYPQNVYHPQHVDLNELYLLESLQRQYLIRQQQRERKIIQKMNQPVIEQTQDRDNYYVVLNKSINRDNYYYINRFNGYSIRQVGNDKLLIRSAKDNFYKTLQLPNDVDLESDITYKFLNDGYQLIVTIPKKTAKTEIPVDLFTILTNTVANEFRNNCQRKVASNAPNPQLISIGPSRKTPIASSAIAKPPITTRKIRVPITQETSRNTVDVQTRDVSPKISSKETISSTAKMTESPKKQILSSPNTTPFQANNSDSALVFNSNSDKTSLDTQKPVVFIWKSNSNENCGSESSTEDEDSSMKNDTLSSKINSEKNTGIENQPSKQPNYLKNYETINRKTIFLPNAEVGLSDEQANDADSESDDISTDEEKPNEISIPVKKIYREPKLEDVVDIEFR